MLYALLAYHDETVIDALSPTEDEALMDDINAVHARLTDAGHMGPAARLDFTRAAKSIRRGRGGATVTDGPFIETKEHLLGLYVMAFDSEAEALEAAKALCIANPHAGYELRPITYYLPGAETVGAVKQR